MTASRTPARAIELFYSYSHKDEEFREQLETDLAVLKRQGVLTDWHDRRIGAGMEWEDAIDDHLNRADIVLLLISPDFIASNYCYDVEMTRAMERHDNGEARVIPVILRYVDNWEQTPFGKLQALPKNGKPVKSWTDRDEAFADVAQGIRNAAAELLIPRSTLASPAGSNQPPVWNIPHRRNPNFTGREQLLKDLHTALESGQTAALTQAITGLGGVGKTQTAVEYAYRYASRYDVVWWMRAEEPATLASDYAGLATALELPQKNYKEQNLIAGAVYRWLEQHSKWLLIFDNAQDPSDLQAYIPTKAIGHTLVTSRNPNWSNIAQLLPVQTWMRDESTAFLLKRTGQTDEAAAIRLADALGDLPLALAQAASYVEKSGRSLASYCELLQTHGQELRSRGQPSPDYPDTVATTWDLSFRRVEDVSPAAADLMSLCAFFAPDSIPLSAIVSGSEHLWEPLASLLRDPLRLDEAVATLRRYSFLEAGADTLSIHRLVQAVMRDRMTETQRRMWVLASVQIISAAFPEHGEDTTTWRLSSRLVPHAEAALTHVEKLSPEVKTKGKLLNRLGRYLYGRAEFGAAEGYFERALSSDEAIYGSSDSAVATDLNDLGLAQGDLGDLRSAKEHVERALRIDEAVYGPNHPDVARDLGNLGGVLRDLGDARSAKEHLERALRINEAVHGPNHPEVATRLTNLGCVLRDLGDLRSAKEHHERALRIDEAVYGPNHPNVARDLSNLGNVLRYLGDPRSVKEHLERALRIDETVYGPDHPDVGGALNNLGGVLRDLGDPRSAKEHLERALRIDEAVYGPDHPDVARDLSNLGSTLADMGRYPVARRYLERAYPMLTRFLGEDHPTTILARRNLNAVRVRLGFRPLQGSVKKKKGKRKK